MGHSSWDMVDTQELAALIPESEEMTSGMLWLENSSCPEDMPQGAARQGSQGVQSPPSNYLADK